MYWPDRGSGVGVEPARKPVASAVRQYFTEGGVGQPPTVPGGDWFNQITNELLNVLAAAGIAPSKTDDDQLLQALTVISKSVFFNYYTHVKSFGDNNTGNGVSDDTAAVIAAIESGRALDWGGPDCTYKITSSIVRTLLKPMQWRANGAKIFFHSAAAAGSVIALTLPDTVNAIDGKLTIDANRKAFVGLSLASNGPGISSDITLTDVEVNNVYRSSTAFNGGDGIYIRNGWRNVSLIRPVITNCRMAAGAGIAGSQGIFGITIAGSSGNSPRNVYVENPFIDSVMSEDPTYTSDQDGIRVFNADNPTNKPLTASFLLTGGKIKDCRGRSVKVQSENGRVEGLQLVRTKACDPGGLGALTLNSDIEFQTGCGSVSNIEFHYDGFVPFSVIRFIQAPAAMPTASMPNISGIRGTILGDKVIKALIRLNAAAGAPKMFANISDVAISSDTPVEQFLSLSSGDSVNAMTANLSNVFCPISSSLVALTNTSVKKRVYGTNVHNTADTPANVQEQGNNNEYVSLLHSSGFVDANSVSSLLTSAVTRINAIAPEGVSDSGILRPVAFTLADGATFQLPWTGVANGVHMLLISVGVAGTAGSNAQGIFAVRSSGLVQLSAGGTEFSLGTTAEPATGNYRIWGSNSPSKGPLISNHSGASRVITCLQFG